MIHEPLETRQLLAVADIAALGVNGSWKADDVRDTLGADLVGTVLTHAGAVAVTPTAAFDQAISQQLKITDAPAGSDFPGALFIDGTSSNSGKSNASIINTSTGFAAAADLTSGSFSAEYRWYGQPNPTTRTVGFKIGLQSSEWSLSQSVFTATRSGESAWDLVLVHVPATSDNAWSTVTLNKDTGTWSLFRQAGNTYFPAPPAAQTLTNWQADPVWGPRLFGAGAKVTSVQFGLGSGQRDSIGFVDYLTTSLLNGGDRIDFGGGPKYVVNGLSALNSAVDADNTGTISTGDIVQGVSPLPGTYRTFGVNVFATIQSAIDAAQPGETILVAPGTFIEDVDVTKGVTIKGAGTDAMTGTTVSGAIGGGGATFQVSASNVTIQDLRVTRQGNNPTDWNSALNTVGIAIQGPTITNALIQNTLIEDNRTGIDINNTSGHTVINNTITNNRTGMILRNQTDNLTVENNFITGNWTAGVLFLDGSVGTNVPPQQALNSSFRFNNISGNWYGQVVDRQTGASPLPAPGASLKDFSRNWFGSISPSTSTANSTEPGYSAQIPVAFGGTAVPPGGQPDILGPASANIDFTPSLESETDTSLTSAGFQGDLAKFVVSAAGGQIGITGRIQEAIDLSSSTNTVRILTGSYTGGADASSKAIVIEQGTSPGQTVLTGNLVLSSDDTAKVELNGTNPSTPQFDNWVVTGGVTLGDAVLNLSLGYTPALNQALKIIDNDLNDSVIGTFAGLPEGADFVLPFSGGNFAASLSYVGGDGNDVVLTFGGQDTVYVDDDWSGTALGADPDGTGPAQSFGFDSFATIQGGINAVANTGNVLVYDNNLPAGTATGVYAENLVIASKSLGLKAAPSQSPIVTGAGALTTPLAISGATSDVVTDGLAIAGGLYGVTVAAGKLTMTNTWLNGGSNTGVQLDLGATLIMSNSEVSGSGFFGLVANNGSAEVTNSIITGRNVGIVVGPNGTAIVHGSNLAGNSSFGLQSASTDLIDASGNYWGSNTPAGVQSKSQGTVDFTPYLDSGTDTDLGARGFVGDFLHLHVATQGGQSVTANPSNDFRIQEAIDLVASGPSPLITVHSGTYNETAIINENNVTLDGNNDGVMGNDPLLTRTAGSQQTLMTINATGVTVKDMRLRVNQTNNGSGAPIAPVGIAAVNTDFDGLVINNNKIDSIGSAPANWTGSPGLPVRGAGIVLYDAPSGGIPSVTIQDNSVNITSGTSFFQRGVWLAQLNADITGNTIAGAANDVIFQFASGGASLIDDNDFVGAQFTGGAGLVIADPNANAPINVTNNRFTPTAVETAPSSGVFVPSTSLQVNRNVNGSVGSPILIDGNTFTGHATGIDVGGANGVTISDNTFNSNTNHPVVTHVVVDSQSASNNASTSISIDTKIKDNTFNSVTGSIATAVRIKDTLAGSSFLGLQIGGSPAADKNAFAGLQANDIAIQVAGGKATITESINNLTNPIAVSGGEATITGTTLTGIAGPLTGTGVSVTGTGKASILNNSVTGFATGVDVNAGKALLQGNVLTGNTVGLRTAADATVDAGQNQAGSPTDFSSLGSGSGTFGSSTGGNILTGYTGASGNFAIENLNVLPPPSDVGGPPPPPNSFVNVYAQSNNFGTSSLGLIEQVVYHVVDDSNITQVFFSPPTAPAAVTPVYVDADWSGASIGGNPEVGFQDTLTMLPVVLTFGVNSFATIQDAIDAVGLLSGIGTIYVLDSNYTQMVNVHKSVNLLAVTDLTPSGSETEVKLVAPSGVMGDNLAVMTITADDVTVDGFHIVVDQDNAAAGIAASEYNLTTGVIDPSFAIDGLKLTNNKVTSIDKDGTADKSFNVPNFSGTTGVGIVVLGNGEQITVQGNTVETGTGGNVMPGNLSIFSRGLWLRGVYGSIGGSGVGQGNTLNGLAQDMLVQFSTGGVTSIVGNTLNLAGIDISGPNAGVNITDNDFAMLSPLFPQSLLIRSAHSPSAPVMVSDNTFTGHTTGIVLDNSSAVTIDNNAFTPATTATNYAHIVLDTNRFNSTSVGTLQPVGATITKNTFSGAIGATGTAILLKDSNTVLPTASPDFGTVTLGGAGTLANTFDDSLTNFIVLDATGAGGAVTKNLDAKDNLFDVGSGAVNASAMSLAHQFHVEDRITHSVDNGALGFVNVVDGKVFVTAGSGSIQRGVNAADVGETVHVKGSHTYDETVIVNKNNLTIDGDNDGVMGNDPLLTRTAGSQQVLMTINATGVTVKDMHLRVNQNDDAVIGGTAPIAPVGIAAVSADFDGLVINNNKIDSIGSAPANWTGAPPFSLTVRAAGIVLHGQSSPSSIVEDVDITNNTISILSGTSFFQRGVWLTALNADITGNTIAGAANDVIFQFASGGASLIDNNDFVGQHRAGGAGLVLADPNSGSPITVSNNAFAPVAGDPAGFPVSLQVNHSTVGATSPINITGNSFTGHALGVDIGGANGVTVQGNTFTPAANLVYVSAVDGEYVDIRVDSQNASNSGSTAISIDTKIFNNTFHSAAGSTGTAVRIEDDLYDSSFAGLQIGGTALDKNDYSGLAAADTAIRVAGGKATIAETISGLTSPIAVRFGEAIITGTTLTGIAGPLTGTGIAVSSNGRASVVSSSVTGFATGVDVTDGRALLQGNTLTGNKVGLRTAGSSEVDAGQDQTGSPSNFTGLGTGSGILGSSTGGNVLTGYTGVGGSFAIENLIDDEVLPPPPPAPPTPELPPPPPSPGADVYAQRNNFGTSSLGLIEQVVYHVVDNSSKTRVFFSPPAAPAAVTPVYVDADWTGSAIGGNPEILFPVALTFGVNSFATIQDAIDAVGLESGIGTIYVLNSNYTQMVNVHKSVNLLAVTDLTPSGSETEVKLVAPSGVMGDNLAVMTITADDVTVDGFHIVVDQDNAAAGIAASEYNLTTGVIDPSFAIDGLKLTNNKVTSIDKDGTADKSFNVPNFSGTTGVGIVVLGNGEQITVQGNTVETGTGGNVMPGNLSIFSRGLWLRGVYGSIGGSGVGQGNTLNGLAQDMLVQFSTGGVTSIVGNTLNLAGIDISGPNAGVNITDNDFAMLSPLFPQSLLIRSAHSPSAPVMVSDNTFTGHTTGIVLDNSSAVTIDNNAFTPATTATNYAHIVLDTNRFNSTSVGTLQPVGATITKNTFSGAIGATGTAILLKDSNTVLPTASPDFGTVTLGGAGTLANTFDDSLTNFIVLDATGAGGAVTKNLDAKDNLFDVGSGAVNASAMSLAHQFHVEDRITHSVDNGALGFVNVVDGKVFVTAGSGSIQRGVNAADVGETVHVKGSHTYDETVIVNKNNLTIDGDNDGVMGNDPLLTRTAGSQQVLMTINATGVTVKDMHLRVNQNDDAVIGGTAPIAPVGIAAVSADFDGLTLSNNKIDSIGDNASTVWTGSPSLTTNAAGVVLYGPSLTNGIESVTLTGNDIQIASGSSFFQRAVWLSEVQASVKGNTLAGASNDLLLAFASGGTTTIGGPGVGEANMFVGQHRGGGAGLWISGPNAGSPINVLNNTFAASGSDPYKTGIQINQNPQATSPITISNNTFTGEVIGVSVGNAIGTEIKNNVFTPAAGLTPPALLGGADFLHVVFDAQSPSLGASTSLPIDGTVHNNTFNANTGSEGIAVVVANTLPGGTFAANGVKIGVDGGNTYGSGLTHAIQVAGGKATITETISNLTNPIAVSGGEATITGTTLTGIAGPLTGTGVTIGVNGSAIITGTNSIRGFLEGVSVAGSVALDNVNFNGGVDNATDLKIQFTATVANTGTGNLFGGTSYFIHNLSPLAIDLAALGYNATNYDGLAPGVLANAFRIEDKMFHGPDNAGSGVIRVVAGRLYVTTPGTGANDESIQLAIDAATPGNAIDVETGTYVENLTISKDVDVIGAVDGLGVATTTLTPATGGNLVTLTGTSFGDDNTVKLNNFHFDGLAGLAGTGVFVGSTADFASLQINNGSFTSFSVNGVGVFGNSVTGDSVDSVSLSNLSFSNNGTSGTGGTGDVNFFEYNNAVNLTNLTMTGNRNEGAGTGGRLAIQLRGVGDGTGTGTLPSGTIVLNNVDISGKYRNQMIGIQRYADVDALSFNNVKLGGATSEITGSFGASLRFDAVGTGTLATPETVNLGNTLFRGLAATSAQPHEIEFAPDNSFAFLRADGTG
ncbi:MAG: right-handed parallel beta-helix repeat-containing protein, partial [Pirellula sp.]